MKTPIDQQIIESTKLSLYQSNEKEKFQLNVIKLAIKCCLFTCEQVCFLMNEVKIPELKIAIITLIYPNIIDKDNFEVINISFEKESEKNLLDQLIKKNYKEEKVKLYKLKSADNFKNREICFSLLKNDPNHYKDKLKTEKNFSMYTHEDEIIMSDQSMSFHSESRLTNTIDNRLESAISYKNILISNYRLAKYIKSKSFTDEINLKKKLSQFRSFLNNNYISISQSLKIISFLGPEADEILVKEFILAVYPCLYDPQNIEYLIRKIEIIEIQDAIRIKLIGMPNFHFQIYEFNTDQNNCCCIIL